MKLLTQKKNTIRITERKIKRMRRVRMRIEQNKDLQEDGRLTVTGRDENE